MSTPPPTHEPRNLQLSLFIIHLCADNQSGKKCKMGSGEKTKLWKDQSTIIGLAKQDVNSDDVMDYGPKMLGEINGGIEGWESPEKRVIALSGLQYEISKESIRLSNHVYQLRRLP